MRKPSQCLSSGFVPEDEEPIAGNKTQNDWLWARVMDSDTHLFLREPAIRELTRRGDNRVAGFCETLLESGEPDDFLVAIDTLTQLGGNHAVTRLVELRTHCQSQDCVIVLNALAQVVTSD